MSHASHNLFAYRIAAVAALGGFLFGFDSGVINGTVSALSSAFGTSSFGTGFSVASVLLGCAVGAAVAGFLADALGRKWAMYLTAVLFIISAFGSGYAQGLNTFIFYRLIGGLGVGAASVLAPTYISEIAPAHMRGRLASLQQLAIVVGLFTAFLSNYALSSLSGGAAEVFWMGIQTWRWMFWAELVPAALFFIGLLTIPESPRYLAKVGRKDEGVDVLVRIGESAPEQTWQTIQASVAGAAKAPFSAIFSRFPNLKPVVWVGIFLSVFQQFVGINVIFYYGEALWRAAGFDESQALFINVLTGFTNIATTFIAIALVDRVGRKPLLLVGSVGMFITLGALALIFGNADVDANGGLVLSGFSGKAALVLANLYVIFFGMSWGPIVWVLLGEMFNNQIRGAAISIAAGAQWIANFTITMTFPIILASFGLFGAYSLYAFFALISIVFVWRFVNETKGKRLEEMS